MLTAKLHHSHHKGQSRWKGRVSEACPVAAAWYDLGQWGSNFNIGSLFQPEKHLTSSLLVSSSWTMRQEREGTASGFVPKVCRGKFLFFFLPCLSGWMQILHTLGELINYKAGWVSKVNDLITFPASLLRSQLSGSGKWGCGPQWRLRCVCVCVPAHIWVSVCFTILRKEENENKKNICVYFMEQTCASMFVSLRLSSAENSIMILVEPQWTTWMET